MLPTVVPNTTIAANSATRDSDNAMATIATLCSAARVTVNPAIGNLATTRPPTKRATTDVPARNSTANDAVLLSVRSSARRTSCWIAPTCEPSTNRYPNVTATKKRVRTASAYAVPYATGGGESLRRALTVGQPAGARRIGSHEPQRERHGAEHEDQPEPRRAGLEPALVEQPFRRRRQQDPADRQPRRRHRQRDRSAAVEPPRDDRGRRHHPGARPTDREHAVDDEQLPLLLHLAEDRQRAAGEQAAAHDDEAHVVAGDQPGRPQPDDAADQEEQRRRQRDRRDVPPALAAERVEVHGEPVEAQARRRGQDDEASGDDSPTGEPVRAHATIRSILAASSRSASVTTLPAECDDNVMSTRFHEFDQSGWCAAASANSATRVMNANASEKSANSNSRWSPPSRSSHSGTASASMRRR